jgi:hypothetical protein
MAQLGNVVRRRGLGGGQRGGALKWCIAIALASSTVTMSRSSWAQPTAEDKAECSRRLDVAEKLVEKDAYYAQAWTDTWYWAGSTLVVLNLTNAFMVGDYRRGESLTFAATSLLLMIQRPLALTSGDALRSIRTSKLQDPCLALADTNSILVSNKVDGEMHRGWPIYVINAAFNLAVMGVLAGVIHHWDFAGHSDLGLQTLAGITLSEIQVATYPSGSLRTSGTSLELTF